MTVIKKYAVRSYQTLAHTAFDRSNDSMLQDRTLAHTVFVRSNDGMLQDRTLAYTAFDRSNDRVLQEDGTNGEAYSLYGS